MNNKELNILVNRFNETADALKKAKEEIEDNSSKMAVMGLIINLEKELRAFPSQAIGSVVLYNILNEKFEMFTTDQFSKIVRFLSHVESLEKNYRELYESCTDKYYTKPIEVLIIELRKEKKAIDLGYNLLTILVNEVQGDLVKFNQVYNRLED